LVVVLSELDGVEEVVGSGRTSRGEPLPRLGFQCLEPWYLLRIALSCSSSVLGGEVAFILAAP
jgi:hypothetical protein